MVKIDCQHAANIIESDGIFIIRDMFDRKLIEGIMEQVDYLFLNNENLGEAVNITALKNEHLRICAEERDVVRKNYPKFYLNEEDFDKGSDFYRHLTNGIGIVNPLCSIKDLWKLVFNKNFQEISSIYFHEESKLGFVKARRFFVNNLPLFDTNYFHIDDNGQKLLKAVIFLNDIDENSGPFVFVKGSHRDVIPVEHTTYKYSRTDKEVIDFYGADKIIKATGQCGDVVLVDTLGVHRGDKPNKWDRNICFVNFVVQEEYGGKGKKLQIFENDFNQLDDDSKRFGQFLQTNEPPHP